MADSAQPATGNDVQPPQWGRIVMTGGTDWPKLGRKTDKISPGEHPDLPSPHLLRSLRTHKITGIYTSSHSSHAVAIDIHGIAYLWGRAASSALGLPGVTAVWEESPLKIRGVDLGLPEGVGFVNAATGRAHTLLVASDGSVWSAGLNSSGQCGHPPSPEVSPFRAIDGEWRLSGDKVIQASAGNNFSLVLTATGKVYAFGSGEKGQLGNGRTGEHIITSGRAIFDTEDVPLHVKGIENRRIVQIASGPQHSLLLDSDGYVLVFGCAGYCRLGLGDQRDTLVPKLVPTFAGERDASRAAAVFAGPTCSAVIDRGGMFWLAGKWKISGDGSAGQPWSTFRYIQDIMGIKCNTASLGGVTLWAIATENDKPFNLGWGQNAVNGELGQGEDKPKSATKPLQIETLAELDIMKVAAGAHTVYFLCRPNDSISDLPLWPEPTEVQEVCMICKTEKGEADSPLECEKCERLYHLGCLTPPLSEIPLGEWFCNDCLATASPSHLPPPSVFKEEPAPGGDSPNKRGRGRPRKYAGQEDQIKFMSEGVGQSAPIGQVGGQYSNYNAGPSGYPMEFGTPLAGEKRERSPDYDDDDGSDYDAGASARGNTKRRRGD